MKREEEKGRDTKSEIEREEEREIDKKSEIECGREIKKER